MTTQRREKERSRIDISPQSMNIIDDLIERGLFESTRELIDAALPLLQIKLVNETQVFALHYEDETLMQEMTSLQLQEPVE